MKTREYYCTKDLYQNHCSDALDKERKYYVYCAKIHTKTESTDKIDFNHIIPFDLIIVEDLCRIFCDRFQQDWIAHFSSNNLEWENICLLQN